jgi:ElaA protein
VFIVEQNCPYQDADELDQHSWHLRVLTQGQLAGYLRIVDPGYRYTEASIGRVLTTAPFRGSGVGQAMMREALSYAARCYPDPGIRLSGQSYLLRFYRSFGFETVGEEYLEDGIAHFEMLRG